MYRIYVHASQEKDLSREAVCKLYIDHSHVCPSINPITGHVEEPMPNPIEEMTEEQKEYEAQKLVSMFDKLSR